MKKILIPFVFCFVIAACKDDSPNPAEELVANPCAGSTQRAYQEVNGLVVIEPEKDAQSYTWTNTNEITGYLSSGYLVWTGDSYMNNPGNQPLTYNIEITNPGTYRFLWRSRITQGTNGTEHNDSWLRFADASDFYGKKGDHIVYPGGTGKSPTPNGTSKDGWFKVYMNGAGEWKWAANTSDNDAHAIYVQFDQAGIYKMEIAARSSHHALDRIILFNESLSMNQATDATNEISSTSCL
jgi:hypothetical protein